MRNRLIVITIITGVALLGIIGLQAFWLSNLYTQEKDHFKEVISNVFSNVIISAQVSNQLLSNMQHSANTPVNLKLNINEDMLKSIVKDQPLDSNSVKYLNDSVKVIVANTPTGNINDAKLKNEIMEKLSKYAVQQDTASPQMVLDKYKQLFSEELQKRSISIPFELAILDKNNAIVKASCDTSLFKRADYKSPACQYDFRDAGNSYLLQGAFLKMNFYLLKKMIWQLTISGLLVIICMSSFTYLIFLFFREKRLTEMRTDFMNNMTHELKTPISSVSVALELISNEENPVSKESQKEYLSIAKGELKRLLLLIERVLKMAAFEKKEIQIQKEYFEVMPWLKEQLLAVKHMFDNKSAVIHTSVVPEHLKMFADKSHLTNVLHNLIENALKYNDKTKPEIAINITRNDGYILIAVQDNGPGILSYYLTKIFDQFVRVSHGDRHDIKGHGLGLSYVKAISELHGGSVMVESSMGKGSTFTIKIPEE